MVNKNISEDISKILIPEENIKKRTLELSAEIEEDYKNKNLMLVGVLKGAFMFISDLSKKLPLRCSVDFISASSYGSKGTKSSGTVKILKDISSDATNKHILIVEDILDSGTTLNFVVNFLKQKKPASVGICTLLNKPSRRKFDVTAKYIGFTIEDEFVVGYGLGYNEEYRNLPYVGVLKKEIWEKA